MEKRLSSQDQMRGFDRAFVVWLIAMQVMLIPAQALAQQVIRVSQSAWSGLLPPERDMIQKKYVVQLAEQNSFGVIIDNQGVDESTPGTNAGAVVGGAVANAAYVDRAIKGGDYSAKNHLAVTLLGVVLGSALDSKPRAQYHFRYAVRLGSGDVQYFDDIKSDPFRHPTGVCVSVPTIAMIEQQLCAQTPASLRVTYLEYQRPTEMVVAPESNLRPQAQQDVGAAKESGSGSGLVNCKLGTLAPVRTSAEKCELIKGSQVP